MNSDNRNVILAVVLSMIVLFGWQFFIAGPQLEQAQRQAEIAAQQQAESEQLAVPTTNADGSAAAPAATVGAPQVFADRETAVAATDRVAISTADLEGSINLTGARIDDLELKQYRETVDPDSPIIALLKPAGLADAYFVEQGWAAAAGSDVALPTSQSEWTLEGDNTTLTAETPVTLRFDNGEGLVFRRTFAVDDFYLFTVTQTVENNGVGDVALFPYSRVIRHGNPQVQNFFIQHEGPIGVLGSNNYVARKYGDLQNERQVDFSSTTGWLGIADKYWATAVLPKPETAINARFAYSQSGGTNVFQTNYVETQPVMVPAGGTVSHEAYVFAGAKEDRVISAYQEQYGFDRLELLIDWGWFHFLTKPMHWLLVTLYGILGNFGLAVLAVTVIVKAIFFPLANRSYASMAAMRRVQPEMKAIQERLKDDRAAQQQAMMELYKKEKINPLSGCWPILIQIPVFFALYKVLVLGIEMRHREFLWIKDLAAPDPANLANALSLVGIQVPQFLMIVFGIGVLAVMLGFTMWLTFKLNPSQMDPMQQQIFNIMPWILMFVMAPFAAGLLLYWVTSNILTVAQQKYLYSKHPQLRAAMEEEKAKKAAEAEAKAG